MVAQRHGSTIISFFRAGKSKGGKGKGRSRSRGRNTCRGRDSRVTVRATWAYNIGLSLMEAKDSRRSFGHIPPVEEEDSKRGSGKWNKYMVCKRRRS